MLNNYIHPRHLRKYGFKIGNFEGHIYLPQDTPLKVVAGEVIESLKTDLEDIQRLLKVNDTILVYSHIEHIRATIQDFNNRELEG